MSLTNVNVTDSLPNRNRNSQSSKVSSKSSLKSLTRDSAIECGKYRNLLKRFCEEDDPNILVFDHIFPGFWNPLSSKNHIQLQGDPKNIILIMVSKLLNICCAAKIKVHITLDDFQVNSFVLF